VPQKTLDNALSVVKHRVPSDFCGTLYMKLSLYIHSLTSVNVPTAVHSIK
jgi:hypothetical protein